MNAKYLNNVGNFAVLPAFWCSQTDNLNDVTLFSLRYKKLQFCTPLH